MEELTKEYLIEEYVNKNRSSISIAKDHNTNGQRIRDRLKKFGIKTDKGAKLRKNRAGEKYGDIVVLRNDNTVKKSYQRVICRCVCGKEFSIIPYNLDSKSRCQECYIPNNYSGYYDLSGYIWGRIKQSARDRNLEFNISIIQAWDLFVKQNKKCALSGVDIFLYKEKKFRKNITASLDRIDSEKGYVLSNIQWVHRDINYMKQDFPEEIFLEWCRKIADYQKD